jgi:ankyrin repeat protein
MADANRSPEQELLNASVSGSINRINSVLSAGVSPNIRNSEGYTPLFLAAFHGNTDIVERLLSAKAKIQPMTLYVAAMKGHADIVDRLLLTRAVNKEEKNKDHYTPLHAAAENGHVAVVARLLNENVKIDALTKNWETPLFVVTKQCAIELKKAFNDQDIEFIHNSLHVINLLLRAGANENAQTFNYKSSIEIALSNVTLKRLFDFYNFENEMSTSEEHLAAIGKEITVKVLHTHEHKGYTDKRISAKIVEIEPCQYELTESRFTIFFKKFNEVLDKSPTIKEMLQYALPSLFPTEAIIDTISDENPLKEYMHIWDVMKTLGMEEPASGGAGGGAASGGAGGGAASGGAGGGAASDAEKIGMNAIVKKRKLILKILNLICLVPNEDLQSEFLQYITGILIDCLLIMKPTQVIKVKYTDYDTFGYYVLHNCSCSNIDTVKYIAEEFSLLSIIGLGIGKISEYLPVLNADGSLTSTAHTLYTLQQTSAINSWVTHGFLSTFLGRPEFVMSALMNPLVGNNDIIHYVERIMNKEFAQLCSAAKPLPHDIKVYRGSPYFKDYTVTQRTVIPTSLIPAVANSFGRNRRAKIVIIPKGTSVIDLSLLNVREQEILIVPSSCKDKKLTIMPIHLGGYNTKWRHHGEFYENINRNTYRIFEHKNNNSSGGDDAGTDRSGSGAGASDPALFEYRNATALEILELKNPVSIKNIKNAYHRLAKIHHPDKGGNTKTFQTIQGAYNKLTKKGGSRKKRQLIKNKSRKIRLSY